jgi:hypothetical protein
MTIITPVVIAVICGLLFVVLLLAGIMRQKVGLVIAAVASLGLCMLAGGIAIYRFSFTALEVVKDATTSRTGEEVYAAEFGREVPACVQIADYYDPAIASQVRICFSFCPQETGRLLQQRKYDVVKRATNEVIYDMGDHCCRNFFTVARFGDTVLECLAAAGTNTYALYVSADSSRAYYIREMK